MGFTNPATRRAYNTARRDEIRAYAKEYRARKRARLNELQRQYRLRNLAQDLDRKRVYLLAHPEYRLAKERRWRARHPGAEQAKTARRLAAKIRATPSWANLDAIRVIYREAARRTQATGIEHHVDHIYPLRGRTVCGLHVEHNLQILTKDENLRKCNKHPDGLAA